MQPMQVEPVTMAEFPRLTSRLDWQKPTTCFQYLKILLGGFAKNFWISDLSSIAPDASNPAVVSDIMNGDSTRIVMRIVTM